MRILSKTTYLTLLCLAAVACCKQNADKRHSDNIIRIRMDTEDTKAYVLTTERFEDSPGKFIMEAYVDRDVFKDEEGQHAHTRVGNAYFGPTSKLEENVIFEDGAWNLWYWNPANANKERCYWVSSNGNMSFWSWVKSQNGIAIDKDNSALYLTSPKVDKDKGVKMVFDYSLPTPTLETYPDATSFDDASNQEDLVFSYWQAALTNETPDEDEPTYPVREDVWVHFYHALSQIRFCFSNDDNSFENNLQIKSIAISDVASGGTCSFWGKFAMDEFIRCDKKVYDKDRDVASVFTWANLKTDKTYRQDYNVTVNSSETEYPEWNAATYSKDSETFKLFTCQNVFMMIPQTLSSKACVHLTIVDSSKPEEEQEQEFISYIKPVSDKWEAGKYYTYKLNYKNDQISFKISLEKWGVVEGSREYTID